MRDDDVTSNAMLGEHSHYGRHAADRGGIGTEVMNDQGAHERGLRTVLLPSPAGPSVPSAFAGPLRIAAGS